LAISTQAQIQLLNDEFDDERSLINWKNINIEEEWGISQLEHYSINDSTAGKMVMIPRTASWFGGYRGPLLYKEVSGDFTITTKVDIMGRDIPSLPELDYNLAGIMIRYVRDYPNGALDPMTGWTSADNNYIFLASGAAANNHPSCSGCPGPHFEVKNTINGNSNLRVVSIDTSSTMIRITRIDDTFIVMYRLESDHIWRVHQRYQRADFPVSVQVGLVVYTDWNGVSSVSPSVHNSTEMNMDPDIIGEFEYFRFDSVAIPEGIGENFMNETDVTNAELLSFLSFASEPYCPNHILIENSIDSNAFIDVNASQSVTLNDTVLGNSTLKISAGDSVLFNHEFTLSEGTAMEVDNDSCISND